MTDPIAAMREALKECANDLAAEIENRYREGIKDHPAMSRKYRRDMEPVTRARAALAAYDAAGEIVASGQDGEPHRNYSDGAPSAPDAMRQQVDKLVADWIDLKDGPASLGLLIEKICSFTARVAADQRERDAKIAETFDDELGLTPRHAQQRIAAGIRTQGERE